MSTKNFRLEYYIVPNQIESDGVLITTYGVQITKKQRKNGVVLTETKTIKNICMSEQQIQKLTNLLAENLVTPITLKDIIDDLVEEQKLNTPTEQMLLDNFAAANY
jgi:fructose-specific phosphotransferase system component IIB